MIKLQRSFSVAFSPDGHLLATSTSSKVVLRDAQTGVKLGEWNVKHPSHLAFSPDGRTLGVKTTSGTLLALDPNQPEAPPRTLCLDPGEGPVPHFTADGRFLVDGSWSGSLQLRRSDDGVPVWQRDHPNELITAIHPDAVRASWVIVHVPMVTTSHLPPPPVYLTLWDYPFGKKPIRIVRSLVDARTGTALTSDGALLAVRHGIPPDRLSLFDLPSGRLRKCVPVGDDGAAPPPAWSAKGQVLAIAGKDCVIFYDRDLVKLGELTVLYPCALAFSAEDRGFAVGSWSAGMLLMREELPFTFPT